MAKYIPTKEDIDDAGKTCINCPFCETDDRGNFVCRENINVLSSQFCSDCHDDCEDCEELGERIITDSIIDDPVQAGSCYTYECYVTHS